MNPASFENIQDKWIPEIRRHCPGVPFIIVGTQADLRNSEESQKRRGDRAKVTPVSEAEAIKLAKREKAVKYMECSALTQKGLKAVFDEALLAVISPQTPKKRGCTIV